MGRKANQDRIRAAEKTIKANPGHRAGHYARKLGCHRETFNRVLVQFCEIVASFMVYYILSISLQKRGKNSGKTTEIAVGRDIK